MSEPKHTEAQVKAARAQIAAVVKDGFAEINGREYHFIKMVHKQSRKVMTYYTSIQKDVNDGNLLFMDSNQFVPVERLISEYTTFEGMTLDKLKDHWDAHPSDYVKFTLMAMAVISYPLMGGGDGG